MIQRRDKSSSGTQQTPGTASAAGGVPPDELPNWHETVQGGKLVRFLEKFVGKLRDERPHGNQELFLDDVFVAQLLAFLNPSIRSLRTLEDFSQTRQAQRHLSIRKLAKSTLSDFHKVVDPELLQPMMQALRAELQKRRVDGRLPADLRDFTKQIIAVDGTFLHALADVVWAVASRNQTLGEKHRARLDVHVDVDTWLPELITVPDVGESEADNAARHVKPGAIHVYDRGYISFLLIAAHYLLTSDGSWTPQADFVIRTKQPGGNAIAYDTIAELNLTPAAVAADVISDRLVRCKHLERDTGVQVVLREVVVQGSDGKECRLLTNLLDLPAEVIALLYRQRWQVELFFRWLKSYGQFRHLISHSRSGVLLQFHVALIAMLLMYLHTGYRPSKYLVVILGFVLSGEPLDSVLEILRERERRRELDRLSAARRREKARAEKKKRA
jgi:Transposase DDE domain